MDNLANLHEVLHDSAFEDFDDEPLHEILRESSAQTPTKKIFHRDELGTTFHVDRRLKAVVDEICAQNATTPSRFFRAICNQLVAEYIGVNVGSKKWNDFVNNLPPVLK